MERKIYIESLTARNNGCFQGGWIDASSDLEEMEDQMAEILGESFGEWIVSDSEGLGGVSELVSLQKIVELEELFEEFEHQPVLLALRNSNNEIDARYMLENYIGSFEDKDAIAEHFLEYELMDFPKKAKDLMYRYLDTEAYLRDKEHGCSQSGGVIIIYDKENHTYEVFYK